MQLVLWQASAAGNWWKVRNQYPICKSLIVNDLRDLLEFHITEIPLRDRAW